ncbi:MAG: hypothetical protein CL610_19650 [Anaerolineaceae bacterium]|nr:hypothetical protein [Anaerolineaceae bacterium]
MKKAGWLLIGVMLFTLTAVVSAHEGRTVGEYELTFGWRAEPALAGMMNGPEVYLSVHGHEEAEASDDHEEGADHEVTFPADIEVNLQAEVTFGSETRTITLRPAWGETGHYIAEMVPTMPGDYTFHLTGTIGDIEVDELFSSSDGQFSSVEPAADVMFPAVGSLEARIAELERRIAELEAALAE